MALFDPPDLALPSRWKEFSLDFKLTYVFQICMAVLFMYAQRLSVKQELFYTIVLATILVSVSLSYRRSMNWRWPGLTANRALNATVAILVAAAYEYAGTVFAPISDPRFLPIHVITLAIFAFFVLRALDIVQPSRSGFLKHCEVAERPELSPYLTDGAAVARSEKPSWKSAVRTIYGLVYQLISLDLAAFLYFLGVALRNGSPKSTPAQTDSLVIAERYVRHGEKVRLEILLAVWVIGLVSLAVGRLVLRLFLGVRLFPDLPTYRELSKQTPRE